MALLLSRQTVASLLDAVVAVFIWQHPTALHDLDSGADVVRIITGMMAPCTAIDNRVSTPECRCLEVAHGSGVDSKS